MKTTYKTMIVCGNCRKKEIYEISKGKTAKEHSDKIKCPRCGIPYEQHEPQYVSLANVF